MIHEQDKALFDKNFFLYDMLIKHQFVKNYTKETYSELIYLYTKYVNDKHNFSHWCSSCRAELVNHLYNWYGRYINNAEQKVVKDPVQIVIEEPVTVEIEEPVKVKEETVKKRKKK